MIAIENCRNCIIFKAHWALNIMSDKNEIFIGFRYKQMITFVLIEVHIN